MSNLVVRVTTLSDVKPHPNADRLELAVVGGWQTVVPRGEFRPGDTVVYFPPDCLLPPETSDRFGVTKYLSNGRIRCARLRGEPSFGLVVRPDLPWPLDTDVAEHYGATKYEPPPRFIAGDAEVDHPLFPRYTEIENLRHYPDAFGPDEAVVLTEKIHGTCCRVGLVEGRWMAGSRTLRRKEPEDYSTSTYWMPLSLEPVRRLLEAHGPLQPLLFGEIFGPGVQDLHYGQKAPAFRAFDLLVNGVFLNWPDFQEACTFFQVPTVPWIATIDRYSLEAVAKHARGTAFQGAHLREGVVVKPPRERTDPRLGRLVLKYLSDDYLLRGKEDPSDA